MQTLTCQQQRRPWGHCGQYELVGATTRIGVLARVASVADLRFATLPRNHLLVVSKPDDAQGVFCRNDATTFGGGAWDALKKLGFHALLPPGQPTNMGPPVCEFDKCYDNILYRRVDTAGTPMAPPPVAQVYPAMSAEMEEMADIVKGTNGARTEVVKHAVKAMKKAFQKQVFCTWSDHRPVYAHLS